MSPIEQRRDSSGELSPQVFFFYDPDYKLLRIVEDDSVEEHCKDYFRFSLEPLRWKFDAGLHVRDFPDIRWSVSVEQEGARWVVYEEVGSEERLRDFPTLMEAKVWVEQFALTLDNEE